MLSLKRLISLIGPWGSCGVMIDLAFIETRMLYLILGRNKQDWEGGRSGKRGVLQYTLGFAVPEFFTRP